MKFLAFKSLKMKKPHKFIDYKNKTRGLSKNKPFVLFLLSRLQKHLYPLRFDRKYYSFLFLNMDFYHEKDCTISFTITFSVSN